MKTNFKRILFCLACLFFIGASAPNDSVNSVNIPIVTSLTTYTALDNVGGLIEITSAMLGGSTSGIIIQFVITDEDSQAANWFFALFNSEPVSSTVTDNSPLVFNRVDMRSMIARQNITRDRVYLNNAIQFAKYKPGLPFLADSNGSLWLVLHLNSAPTYLSTDSLSITMVWDEI